MQVSFYSSSSSGSYSGSFLLIHSIKPSFVSFTDDGIKIHNGKGFTLYNGINQINLSMDLVQKQSADPR
jgi:hypothetical protein